MKEKDILELPKGKDRYNCPNCEHSMLLTQDLSLIASTEAEFALEPDPCMKWWEAHKCTKCETFFRISNGT
jgi:hypothetical protein